MTNTLISVMIEECWEILIACLIDKIYVVYINLSIMQNNF